MAKSLRLFKAILSVFQVQFHNAVLCKLRPGMPILALHGKQNQLRRVGIYEAFCKKTGWKIYFPHPFNLKLIFSAVCCNLYF